MHGTDYGAPGRPDWRVPITNTSAEQLVNVFGTATGNRVTSIGFKSSRGTVYGPMNPGDGRAFAIDGLVLGFFGALENGAISGIGVWYMPLSAATQVPVPLPVTTSQEMSPAYGNLWNVWTWDDTPNMGGALHPSLPVWRVQRNWLWMGVSQCPTAVHGTFATYEQQLSQRLTICVPGKCLFKSLNILGCASVFDGWKLSLYCEAPSSKMVAI
jgi:hypothetical protein